jgi:hypothetical protein
VCDSDTFFKNTFLADVLILCYSPLVQGKVQAFLSCDPFVKSMKTRLLGMCIIDDSCCDKAKGTRPLRRSSQSTYHFRPWSSHQWAILSYPAKRQLLGKPFPLPCRLSQTREFSSESESESEFGFDFDQMKNDETCLQKIWFARNKWKLNHCVRIMGKRTHFKENFRTLHPSNRQSCHTCGGAWSHDESTLWSI